ncbi:Fe-S cluster assembly ATPase SufC [Candidatus Roizmanbacteria bacterium RIFCSPHIGHO2_12_FULL_41_11]|uniref:Fe-S cluster assembly ATPase SufC n=3 Tax=Candidatus Roizmaniibacteriota TaxID=1752723 RepID=A0A1F7JS42_9BACT|nr:MAG: Fe-S cluster assembly ATPase SufC [Candidatus Roizmanbacteria bacterium RIFCSPHIGHO2_12_FULL_41_11]OGK52795.1 MAG: Fe-S cluster assembly ATPase SufC [Candidatus Roizmanbacteria bacterium RIFCSPLOWO2_01_FULL_41_22]OGK58418.1 MAG: Fe-S cluster assembly ATPase SufC [Candidatus Roizmanbacteria bacterium RIFCSPLOWO2_02_FULL_41_9]
MLKLQSLSVSINGKQILHKIDFEFAKGKIYAIMGPNGSGKSTLAYTIMGHPTYKLAKNSKIFYNGQEITPLPANERAEKGIFLSYQTPLSLAGVKVNQLLQLALSGKKDPLFIRRQALKIAKQLRINEDLLNRSLNEGASGGERKKMEVLQAAVLDKELMIFDEIDTGVDVDALKSIAAYLRRFQKDKAYIIITHYNRILHYLKPHFVVIMDKGKIVRVGDRQLAKQVEKSGYGEMGS